VGTVKNRRNASIVPPVDGQSSCFISFFALEAAVVLTVTVEVWAAVPLMVTEVGFKPQVGASVTLVIVVVTLQLRLTLPLKPKVPTTLTVPVFPVVAPGETVMDVLPPGPAMKPGVKV
jgi:hypothetical protein